MKTVYKYQLELVDDQTIKLPVGFEILSIQDQRGKIEMWCLVDDLALKLDFKFKIVGTGHPIHFDKSEWRHYSTVQKGELVWHIFGES